MSGSMNNTVKAGKSIDSPGNILPVPESAMILAAGMGRRMLPLTRNLPKPLIRVHGKALIDYGLEALAHAGVKKVIVNVHHLAGHLAAHLAGIKQPEILISDERDQLLDSGGGVARALHHFDGKPFLLMNSDSFWLENYQPNLLNMAHAWDPDSMDILILVAGMTNSVGYSGPGDFTMDSQGRVTRRGEHRIAPFIYAGTAILKPQLFVDLPGKIFSLNMLFDRAIERGRMYAIRLDGLWLHVGTPDAIRQAEKAIAKSVA
jgi:N-acetyl-alpha-D-muramate 1-phosphate uridylyltransferase